MSWVRIDDVAPEHPKLLQVGAQSAWLWLCGIAYCNRQKSRDGFIPEAKVKLLYPGLGPKEAKRLTATGLWEATPGGYLVHDYGIYQVHDYDLSAKRAEAGRRGAQRTNDQRGRQLPRQVAAANGSASAAANGQQTDSASAFAGGSAAACAPAPASQPNPSQIQPDTTTQDLSGGTRTEPPMAAVVSQKLKCPRDLRLTDDQIATLETGLIPRWAIEILTTELVASWVADPSDLRPLAAWRKCLSKAVSGEWNRRGTSLVNPSADPADADVPRDSINSAEGFW